jgi:hypothetical protein
MTANKHHIHGSLAFLEDSFCTVFIPNAVLCSRMAVQFLISHLDLLRFSSRPSSTFESRPSLFRIPAYDGFLATAGILVDGSLSVPGIHWSLNNVPVPVFLGMHRCRSLMNRES